MDLLTYNAVKQVGLPVGAQVMMPYTTVPSFTAPSGEVFVKNNIASVIPASQCHPSLISALGADNDVTFNVTSSISLAEFSRVSDVLSASCPSHYGQASTGQYTSTKIFYVGGLYYFFSTGNANIETSYFTSADLISFSQRKVVSALSAQVIVDIVYANSTWHFLGANGAVNRLSDLTSKTLSVTYAPYNPSNYGYNGLSLINGVWYAYGCARTAGGALIVSSTDLSNWTIVLENTAVGYPIVGMIQGSGTGAFTEILATVSLSETFFTSTNNGATFTSSLLGTGAAVYQKAPFYSSRTGRYYIPYVTAGNYIYVAMTGGNTLKSAIWSLTGSVYSPTPASSNSPVSMVDTGTNIGFVYSNGNNPMFAYGSSYGSSTTLVSSTDANPYGGNISSMSLSVNGKVFVISAPTMTSNGGNSKMLLVVSNATLSTISRALYFPSYNSFFCGITNWNGSYYGMRVSGTPSTSFSGIYKFPSDFSGISMATSSIVNCGTNPAGYFPSICPPAKSSQDGTAILWTFLSSGYSWVVSFNGSTVTTSSVGSQVAVLYTNAYGDSSDPSTAMFAVKWSSLLGGYIYGSKFSGSSGESPSAIVLKSSTLGGAAASLLTMSFPASGGGFLSLLDVLSSGHVIESHRINSNSGGYSQYSSEVNVFFNGGIYKVLSYSANAYNGGNHPYISLYEFTGLNGGKYLAAITQVNSGNAAGASYISLNVFSLFDNSAPLNVLSTTISGVSVPQSFAKLRRAFVSGNNIYLGDLVSGSANKNAFLITQSGAAFTPVGAAYCNFTSANQPTGNTLVTYSTSSGSTLINSCEATPIPAVYLPPGAAGSYIKVR